MNDLVSIERELIPALSVGPFKATSMGLIVVSDDPVPFEVWEAYVGALKQIADAIQWNLGDALAWGEATYGEKYAQAVVATDYSEGSLANMKWVASKVAFSRRRENLRFSHYVEVAPLPPDAQDYWLNRAEEEQLSTRQLRQFIHKTQLSASNTEMMTMTIHIILDVPAGLQDRVKGAIGTLIDRMSEDGVECRELNIWEGDREQ